MKLLENLHCFILFFLDIGDSLGRPGGQCWGATWGCLAHGSGPTEPFVCCTSLSSMELFKMFIYTGFSSFYLNFFFSCQGK